MLSPAPPRLPKCAAMSPGTPRRVYNHVNTLGNAHITSESFLSSPPPPLEKNQDISPQTASLAKRMTVHPCVGPTNATPTRNSTQSNEKKLVHFLSIFFHFLKICPTAPLWPPECTAVLPGTPRSTGKYPQARDEPNLLVSHPLLLLPHLQILPPQPNRSGTHGLPTTGTNTSVPRVRWTWPMKKLIPEQQVWVVEWYGYGYTQNTRGLPVKFTSDINSWASQHKGTNYVTVDLQAEHSPDRSPTLDFSSTSIVHSTPSISAGNGPQVPHCSSTWAARAGQLRSYSTSQISLLGLARGVTSQLPPYTSGPLYCDSSKLLVQWTFHSSSQATILSSSGQVSSHSNQPIIRPIQIST
jgi:hypothetical protein